MQKRFQGYTPRRYPFIGGDRGNVGLITQETGFTPAQFKRARRDGLLKLASVEMALGYYGRTEPTYLLTEAKEAIEALKKRRQFPIVVGSGKSKITWLSAYTFENAKRRTFSTVFRILKLHPELSRNSIERWAGRKNGAPCRFLLNKKGQRRFIEAREICPPIGRCVEKVLFCQDADIDEIVNRMGQDQPTKKMNGIDGKRWIRQAIHNDQDGREWLTDVQFMDRHDVGRGFFRWAKKESKRRPCPDRVQFDKNRAAHRAEYAALRSKPIPNSIKQKGSPGEVTVYLDDDALPILNGEESEHRGVGKGANAERLRDELLEKAKKVVATLLDKGRELPTGRLVRLVEEKAGVGEAIARRAVKKITVERKEGQNKRFRRLRQHFVDKSALTNGSPATPSVGGPTWQTRLPRMASAPDLARLLGKPTDVVESFLRRYRHKNPNCWEEVGNPRRNQPRILYYTDHVWPALQDHFCSPSQ